MCTQCHLIEHFPTKTCDLKSDSCITEPSKEWEVPMLATHSNSRVTLQVLQYILVNSLDNPSDNCEIALSPPCRETVRHYPQQGQQGLRCVIPTSESWVETSDTVCHKESNKQKYKILFLASLQNRTCSEKILSYIQNKWKMGLLSQYI